MVRKRSWAGVWLVVAGAWAVWTAGTGQSPQRPEQAGQAEVLAVVSVAQLPPQGQEMMRLIHQGGPFRYEKDGTVFGNRERLLPIHKRGYYREYTVPTPGLNHRGARRIVCGGTRPREPEACYYTADHYASFKRIVQ